MIAVYINLYDNTGNNAAQIKSDTSERTAICSDTIAKW